MRPVAERLLLRETTAAELWVLNGASDISFSIDKVDRSCDANRSALRINKCLDVIGHLSAVGFSRGSREGPVSEMGGAALTLSLTQSGEYVHG